MDRRKAFRVVALALALGLAPDPAVSPAAWATENLVVADGPLAGHRWSMDQTPYAREILDCLSVHHPATRVSVRKSSQVGLTQAGIAWLGSIIDNTPARALVVFPTIPAVQEFNREKFAPTIESSPRLAAKVSEAKSRSARASTALSKRFPGGSITLTGANSASDLRSKTAKFLFCDEVDEWPLDLDKQGDPMKMADARQIAFHATADYKKLECSTPRIKGASRIDDAFEAGDQRYWQVPCPECGEYQRLIFKNLKFEKAWPFEASYQCAHCGSLIAHGRKNAMIDAGRWVAEKPEPGRHPSFHIDALTSKFTTWDILAEEFQAAKDDPVKLKAFVNLWLGEAWEERGEAPEWQRLFARRDDYRPRHVPVGGVILTGAADVQADGIFYEIVAWGARRESWSVDIGWLDGDTADPASPVWAKLDEVYSRRYPDAYGNSWPVDKFAVDSGHNANTVYQWTRKRARAMAIKGADGWHHAAISSAPTKVDVTLAGKKKKRRGAELWHIGTWPLKAELYANLRKDGRRDGAELDPPGFCHFTEALHDERFFKQLTAEHLADHERKGRIVKEWVASGPNHYHDCRIYNMALAIHLGLGVMTDREWAVWVAVRTRPAPQADLIAAIDAAPPVAEPSAETPAVSSPASSPASAAPAESPSRPGYLQRRPARGAWLNRR